MTFGPGVSVLSRAQKYISHFLFSLSPKKRNQHPTKASKHKFSKKRKTRKVSVKMFTHIKIAKYQNTEKPYITKNYKIYHLKKRNKKLQNKQKGSRFNGCHQKNHKNFEKYSHLLVLSANRQLGQLNSVLTKKQ